MTVGKKEFDSLTDEALRQTALALLGVQSAERAIKFCVHVVLPKDGDLRTHEEFMAQQKYLSKRTLGFLLAKLRKRAQLDEVFDQELIDFIDKRNQLIHNIDTIQNSGYTSVFPIKNAIIWIQDLMTRSQRIRNIFIGLIRSWSKQIGIPDLAPPSEFHNASRLLDKIDSQYAPLTDSLFSKKP